MALLRDEWLIPVGGLCLAVAILADRFLPVDSPILDFVFGVLAGVFMVLNLAVLYRMRTSKK
jgi:hypothetical protein